MIPLGKVVDIELISNNVIHSFWVPEIAGKTDVIPGRTNKMWLKADRTGTFRGECTEYCGQEHANMSFQVVVEDVEESGWVTGSNRVQARRRRRCQGRGSPSCFTCHLTGNGERGTRLIQPDPLPCRNLTARSSRIRQKT